MYALPMSVLNSATLPYTGPSLALRQYGADLVSANSIDASKLTVISKGSANSPISGIQYNANAAPAVTQTDLLSGLNFAAAGDAIVIDFGVIHHFLDLSGTALVVGKIQMIDSNGVDHDLAVWTKTKAQQLELPAFPPGRYKFTNVSGGALTGYKIYAIHTGARNLA